MRWIVFIYCLFCFGVANVQADGDFVETLRVSCMPETNVFRAEVLEVPVERLNSNPALLKNNGLFYWERTPLEKRGFETPLSYDVSCEIDGVAYQMSFYDLLLNEELDDYTKGVVLKANGRYIGDLSPLGATRRHSYDKLEVSKDVVLVLGNGDGCEHCYHYYQVPLRGKKGGYTFNQLEKDNEIVPMYNVVEFMCYRDFGLAGARLYAYEKEAKLTRNHYWLKDKPAFQCDDIKIMVQDDNSVRFYQGDKLVEDVSLLKEGEQVYHMIYYADLNDVIVKSVVLRRHAKK